MLVLRQSCVVIKIESVVIKIIKIQQRFVLYKMIPLWANQNPKLLTESKATAVKLIQSIDYTVLSSQDILSQSVACINKSELYDSARNPSQNGPLDTRLGIGSRSFICSTCNHNLQNCIGHFGHAQLSLPIYHIGYFKNVITTLKMICKKCYRVTLEQPLIKMYRRKMTHNQNNYFSRLNLFKKISKQAMKAKYCPHCGCESITVQKVAKICDVIKMQIRKKQIVRSKIRKGGKAEGVQEEFVHELSPWDALKALEGIPEEQQILMNVGGKTRLRELVVMLLPVPPVNIRPSVMLTNSLSNEDDLTMKIKDIILLNHKIQQGMIDKGDELAKLNKSWYLMQSHWAQYLNSDSAGLPLHELKNNYVRSLVTRLKGKQGRFRQNLSGKRANFTARTVISPDPNLHPTQVIVPEHMSKILTIQETVTPNAIQMLQECVERGPHKKGGANFVLSHNQKTMLGTFFKSKIQLKNGDIVERHLRDGDIVIFNRQPSLHRLSMMGFKVKIASGKTLRFNECVCAPFNADFDGDQMNIHVPQTLEARSETLHLMGVTQNIMTPKSGQPIIALIQDFITTSFLVTSKDLFLDRSQFTMILGWITDADELIELPAPAIFRPVQLWTGKQVFSSILRPNRYSKVIVNFQTKEKNYKQFEAADVNDGWVVFRNSQLIVGQIGKNTLGGNKSGLIYNLIRDNTLEVACEVMHRISKLSSRWISNYGMTIGISDVTPSLKLSTVNKQAITHAYSDYKHYLKDFQEGVLEAKPGMSTLETLQSLLNSTLSKVRQTVGDNCIQNLDRYNKPLIMAVCGSKGNAVNLSQMIGCVGQQTVGGKRISFGFTERTIPHFKRQCKSPEARGFVKNSFFSGLTATEFFFHTMGGREGIIDTAVKTADTGYMQRRLIKLIQDIAVMYDYTIRTCDRKEIIQFRYGDDGMNPMRIEDNIVDLPHLEKLVKAMLPHLRTPYLSPAQIQASVSQHLEQLRQTNQIIGIEPLLREKIFEGVRQYFQKKSHLLSQTYHKINQYQFKFDADQTYLRNSSHGISQKQLEYFFKLFVQRVNRAILEPGESIGAITAQSIGQPATQMTLKTFHFAGISSMNITQGVPRVNEIINCSKNIATPIVTVSIIDAHNKDQAIKIKNQIEKLTLASILLSIEEIYSLNECCLRLKICEETIFKLKLGIGAEQIKVAIERQIRTKIKKIQIQSRYVLTVVPVTKTNMMFELKSLRRTLCVVCIGGIPSIPRALISKDKENRHVIYAEGTGLREILGMQGVRLRSTFSNHILEIEEVLGVEAARQSIINQIGETMKEHGVNVNPRHINLLAEFMTAKGRIIGFTRNGVDKIKDSTLMLASFEKTADFLFDAALQGKHDRLRGVSEKIIMGQPITLGTGMFDLRLHLPNKLIYGN